MIIQRVVQLRNRRRPRIAERGDQVSGEAPLLADSIRDGVIARFAFETSEGI